MIIIIKIIMIIVIIFSMTIITKIATIIIYNVYDQTTDAQTFRGIESTLVTFTPITPSTAARNEHISY